MNKLINLNTYPVKQSLKKLLQDKTTKKNIIWATSSYEQFGDEYVDYKQIKESDTLSLIIEPRILKALEHQAERTKSKGEVFTPAWICNQMNNYCDEEWFGRKDVFNFQHDTTWKTNPDPIEFKTKEGWKDYIKSCRIEITCGEAPYLVSRYDAATGKEIPVKDRIGILDRKFRVINENVNTSTQWYIWAKKAFQSVYGYEYQGDNLLIARINLLMTFVEHYEVRWGKFPSDDNIKQISDIISWNIWQMDGLKGSIPLGAPIEECHQMTMMEYLGATSVDEQINTECKIMDWFAAKPKEIYYKQIRRHENEI